MDSLNTFEMATALPSAYLVTANFFDAFSGAVAILPVTKSESFQGQEYLGIYPYIDEAPIKGSSTNKLWINRSGTDSKQ